MIVWPTALYVVGLAPLARLMAEVTGAVAVAVAWLEVSPAPDAVALLVTEPALRSAWLIV